VHRIVRDDAHAACGYSSAAALDCAKRDGRNSLLARWRGTLMHGASQTAALQVLSARRVYEILKGISDEDCMLLGFNPKFARPDWMMVTVLPVPPPHVRPAIEMDSTGRCEDDLTHQYAQIVKDNQALRAHQASGSPEHVLKARAPLLLPKIGLPVPHGPLANALVGSARDIT
jgi:DNA-directed RNA polymerase beta' subunit